MGFIVMVLSAIIGIFLIVLGFSGIKNKKKQTLEYNYYFNWNSISFFCNLVRTSQITSHACDACDHHE